MPKIVTNPIIPGFAPDPSLVRVGPDYFLVNSSFHMFPGLPIYTSQDLVHWKHIGLRSYNVDDLCDEANCVKGNAIHRQSQLDLYFSSTKINPDLLATGGLFAPTIRYQNNSFYIVCTNIIHRPDKPGRGENFIISTNDIWAGDWSDPVLFDHDGIDPSIFFDDDGKAYLHGSHTVRPGVTEINLFEIDLATGQRLSEEKNIWAGTGGKYPEGPHIYKKDGWYYLMISEGGTHEGHMVTMARSSEIWGHYEPCPDNPILTASGTDEYVQYTGHCEAFSDTDGQYWGVCLGVRKDQGGRYIMGRETFLTGGSWKTGHWLTLDTVKLSSNDNEHSESRSKITAQPNVDYLYIRNSDLRRYNFLGTDSTIMVKSSTTDLFHPNESPSFIGKRQRELVGTASVTFTSSTKGTAVKAGLVVYKDEHRFLRIFFDNTKSCICFEIVNKFQKLSRTGSRAIKNHENIHLKISYTEQEYCLAYSTDDTPQIALTQLNTFDTIHLTDPDFVGPVIGAFAVDEGTEVGVAFQNLKIA